MLPKFWLQSSVSLLNCLLETVLVPTLSDSTIQDSKVFICHIHIQNMQWNVCVTYTLYHLCLKKKIKYNRIKIRWNAKYFLTAIKNIINICKIKTGQGDVLCNMARVKVSKCRGRGGGLSSGPVSHLDWGKKILSLSLRVLCDDFLIIYDWSSFKEKTDHVVWSLSFSILSLAPLFVSNLQIRVFGHWCLS